MWTCYLDGYEVRVFETEMAARNWCWMYDGDKEATYEFVED